jgi:hypothetical protein
MERSLFYHVADASGTRLVSIAPEEIRRWLRDGKSWLPGRYTVFVIDSVPTWLRRPGVRWGVAVKHTDGSVELVPDRLA